MCIQCYHHGMNKYLSHISAAKYWNIPYLDKVIGDELFNSPITEYTVTNPKKKYRLKDYKLYVCTQWLPEGSITNRNGMFVSSPELVFLQLATRISFQRLVLLGLQLCSHPPGRPRDAMTSKKNLEIFLKKVPKYKGCRKAQKAIKFVDDGSGSIMESIVFMIFTMPNLLGGYGLTGACLNYEVTLMNEAKKRLNQKKFFVDIYYKGKKVAVEYDSYAHHSNTAELGRDSIRSALIERQGIKTMHMNTAQLYNVDACDDFALNLAKCLGKRIYIRTDKYDKTKSLLRDLLPSKP